MGAAFGVGFGFSIGAGMSSMLPENISRVDLRTPVGLISPDVVPHPPYFACVVEYAGVFWGIVASNDPHISSWLVVADCA